MQLLDKEALHIYTDGSSLSKPRRGGAGFVFVYLNEADEEKKEEFGLSGYRNATNNEMELHACVEALKEVLRFRELGRLRTVCLFTDSSYVVDNRQRAMFEWQKTKWTKRFSGDPVANTLLWKELLKQIKKIYSLGIRLEIRWVKGHSKNIFNKAADKLAKQSAKNFSNEHFSIVNVRKRIFEETVPFEDAKLRGKRLSVRIVTDQFLEFQKTYKYKCEIISPKSEFYKQSGFMFGKMLLSAGHHYLVVLMDKEGMPTIERMIREHKKHET